MIEFPETAASEWRIVADAANIEMELRKRITHDTLVEGAVAKMRVNHEAKLRLQQELDAEDTPDLVMMTIAEFVATTPAVVTDMIEGVMKADSLCTVLGPSGVGKTTLALQMVHSLLTGDEWLGRAVQKITGAAGILSYDQNSGMMTNWIHASGLDTSRVSMVDAHGRGNPLGVPEMRAKIAAAWRRMEVEVVLIDSFSASFHGLDQNDTALTMAYYRDIKKFAYTEVGAKAIIIIVHSTAASPLKARGSTAHKDVADTVVVETLTDPADKGSPRKIQMEKYRAGIGQTEMTPIVVTAPDDVTHLLSLDYGGMSLAGLPIPASAVAQHAFTVVPDPHAAPDTDSDDDREDDL